jgi:hypothetical protein
MFADAIGIGNKTRGWPSPVRRLGSQFVRRNFRFWAGSGHMSDTEHAPAQLGFLSDVRTL